MAPICQQLFLSTCIVTDEGVIDGGVLVTKTGVIEGIFRREEAIKIISKIDGDLKIIDGGDLALLPGVVDSHVHVNEPGRTAWEGFPTATAAAVSGGITTIIDMPLNCIPPTTTVKNLQVKASAAKDNIYADVGFWGGVIPGNQDNLQDLVRAGVVGFKCFLCPSGVDEFPHVSREDLEITFAALEGTGSVLAFHAELDEAMDDNNNYIENNKDPEDFATYLETRPSSLEINAMRLIVDFVKTTDVRVHVVHVSSAAVVPLLCEARAARLAAGCRAWRSGVTAETCHHYLTLSAEQIPRGCSEYKCAPPVRDTHNREKLWQYLLYDKLDLVVSDHSPCVPELKCPDNLQAWGGISSVQFGLSLFWTEASARGLDLRAIAKYLCSGPAHLCGLQNRKGAIKPGRDADLVFFDANAYFLVTKNIIRHRHKLTPYVDRELKGVVKQTYLRGQLVYDDGKIIEGPKGKLILNEI